MTWPPPYPYDRLNELKVFGENFEGGLVDLSIGRPCDPPPAAVIEAQSSSGLESGYPPSIGNARLRGAAQGWLSRRFGIEIETDQIAACVGSKEFVASTPRLLHMRSPERDTVLYPEVAYPTYAMGATLGGLRAVPVKMDDSWRIDLSTIDPADTARALCLWVNTPGNPAGGMDDLAAAAEWGREHGVPVLSDECYIEFTWSTEAQSVLRHGTEGVIALHSLSKRSNYAGGRVGMYAGDTDLVRYLSECRKHSGQLIAGPMHEAGAVAFDDDEHVDLQRQRYLNRMNRLIEILNKAGIEASLPNGSFYLWVKAPTGDGWDLARQLAENLGMLVSPGEFYGPSGSGYVRLAAVEPLELIDRVLERV